MEQPVLFELLFKRNISEPGTKGFLEQLVNEHPYFTPAQFYLLKQTGKETPEYNRQAARTAIFFDNPYWLNFQLTRSSQTVTETKEGNSNKFTVPENMDNDADEALLEKEIPPLNIELKIPEVNKTDSDASMIFEPMHLVDYFGSQGIKLSEEALQGDKLGKQLKSFTEWLKTMKKLHNTGDTRSQKELGNGGTGDQSSIPVDPAIQSLAEKSNSGEEVLTESMAEVLVKQGKTGKATELYQKLSLLNPSKIAYFAAKIEQLKEI